MTIYFGENLKRLRKEKEMTQEKLASFLGLSFQAVSKWERWDTYPDITMLSAISSFFGVSIDELLGVDSIRMWAKRLICQHLHSKAYFTGDNSYQTKAEDILNEMPELINTREYLSTMLIWDSERHRLACSKAIEKELYSLNNTINHCCNSHF